MGCGKKPFLSSDSIESDAELVSSGSSDGEWNESMAYSEIDEDAFFECIKDVSVGEWVLVELEGKRKLYYIGQIVATTNEQATVNFLKKMQKPIRISRC